MEVRFAVTGVERSGTAWLALALGGDPAVEVQHEPPALRAWDASVLGLAHTGHLDADWFVRARYHYWRRVEKGWRDRAEVNAYLRYVAGTVRDVWGIPVAAVVRDGRATVRSVLVRGTFEPAGLRPVEPPKEIEDDPLACCAWYWADAYERLAAQGIGVWRLEDLDADFAALRDLCGFLDIEADETTWRRWRGCRVNQSIVDPEPPRWTDEDAATFERWAGATQRRLGYDGAGGL